MLSGTIWFVAFIFFNDWVGSSLSLKFIPSKKEIERVSLECPHQHQLPASWAFTGGQVKTFTMNMNRAV